MFESRQGVYFQEGVSYIQLKGTIMDVVYGVLIVIALVWALEKGKEKEE